MSSDQRKVFGTDGVRGVANVEPMTCDTAMRLGMAISVRMAEHHQGRRPRIVIGKDTRLSGYMFESALAAGVVSVGADVWLTGPIPTPAIAFITASMRCDAGVVISASHNPYPDNGIKIFARDGFKLDDALELEIEALLDSPSLNHFRAPPAKIGYSRRISDSVGRYVVFCKGTFPDELVLDGLTIVVDGANGAAYRSAPSVLEELGARVIAIHCEPNGKNINDGVGALHLESLSQKVIAEGADLGIALDGDGDRVMLVDARGRAVDGDVVMAMCARRLLARDGLARKTVVATVMSNLGLERAIEAHGGQMVRTQVGDRYVVDHMRRGGYNFGGEQSGHLVFLDHNTTGDGIIAALQVLAIMVEEGQSLEDLAKVMERVPQVLVNVVVEQRRPIEDLGSVRRLIAETEARFGVDGRVLVRYSGTESKARVMIEGPDEKEIREAANEIADALAQACS